MNRNEDLQCIARTTAKKSVKDERTNSKKISIKPYPHSSIIMCKTIAKNTHFEAEKQLKIGTFADIRNIWKTTKLTTEN